MLNDCSNRRVPAVGDLGPFILHHVSECDKVIRDYEVFHLGQAGDEFVHSLHDGLVVDTYRVEVELKQLCGLADGLLGLQPTRDRLLDEVHGLCGVVLLQVLGGLLLHLLGSGELTADLLEDADNQVGGPGRVNVDVLGLNARPIIFKRGSGDGLTIDAYLDNNAARGRQQPAHVSEQFADGVGGQGRRLIVDVDWHTGMITHTRHPLRWPDPTQGCMMPEIVVLDGYTTSPLPQDAVAGNNEVSWQALARLGELVVYDRTDANEVAHRIGRAGIALTNKTPIGKGVFEACPDLKYVGVLATGVNVVDLDAARAHSVTVTNIPGYSTPSVAQHVFALLLELCSRTAEHNQAVHDGQWARCKDFSFTTGPLIELAGKTLGIIGMGAIGQATARIGHAFGMKVVSHSRTQKQLDFPVTWMEIDELIEQSDVVSLHCALTPQTEHLINAKRLASMRPGGYLINTGRGPLIDESALSDALHAGMIAGAGLDVLSVEPPRQDNPLLTAPNCVITPHVAWASTESRHRLMQIAASNVRAYLDGNPTNVVG